MKKRTKYNPCKKPKTSKWAKEAGQLIRRPDRYAKSRGRP